MHPVIRFPRSRHTGKTAPEFHRQEVIGPLLFGVLRIYNTVRIPCTKPAHQGLLNYDFPRPHITALNPYDEAESTRPSYYSRSFCWNAISVDGGVMDIVESDDLFGFPSS
jgi:hypothetical protein